ncbi:3-alpha-(or 20-beta)-hydroxysteroid dehydrogenase [Tsuneonella dongtanensis]|uniref:3-alpha-(Or 20-beta)-hydroxysteroid dehydrogenase n=1 Tax=Tsuneonella dongtanensis TaxID=692370 RepID=A0A1B2AB50_9SPHN|nr:SDR family oxidoreductase [Tsuneonella dongtanensis]ANY19362.1 3-alpha-(or 20-beta)-hydroxysteroid dehydrogenase [Tsuneonella dongtanensis]
MTRYATYPSLAGRSVFITGGATGIGAAMVEAFAEQGAVVGHIDLAAEEAEALGESISASGRPKPWFRRVDVTDVEALAGAVSDFAGSAGGLHALVNNVANDTRHNPLETTAEKWRRCMAVNLDCAFFASQEAIKQMRDGNGGAIVNFSSINALLGPENMPGYVTAKAGLLGMTKALAREYGRDGIRVNTILPGWVVTQRQLDLWLTPEAEAEWMEHVCLKQRIEPRDAANLALFLAADDSRMITNQQFVIDGGRV